MVAVQLQPGADARVNVVFKHEAQLDKDETAKQGRQIFKDIEMCEITFAGNKHTKGGFFAHDMADWFIDPMTGEKRERTYAEKYNAEYLAFKNGAPEAQHGTPLSELPFLSEGRRRELRALNIHTAEALASLDDGAIKRIGMGGRELVERAKSWLETAAKANDTAGMAAELAAMRAELAQLKAGGAAPAEPAQSASELDDAFKEFEIDDLRNWLSEAGVDVDKRWNRATLLVRCGEVLEKQGKQKQAA